MPSRPAPSLDWPLDIPAEHLTARIGTMPAPAILEGGREFGPAGRWSIFAARPRLVYEAVADAGDDPLSPLASLVDRFGLADPSEEPDPGACPFQGGLIGFFGYDLAPHLERLPRKAPRDSRLPDVRFALYDTAVVADLATGAVSLRAWDLLGEGPAALERRAREWLGDLRDCGRRSPSNAPPATPEGTFTRAEYLAAVRRSLEYIAAGDIFQVNLSQRFHSWGDFRPLDIYLRLRDRSPAPFACYLQWDDLAVVSASPEWFYQTRGDRIATRPIKGTRPRGATAEDDDRLVRELLDSPKDRAELTMIVDLERNDLGRVCRYGSVRVTEPLVVESFAQVHHLVATIEGRVRPGVGPIDVVRAVFPGGSITGAPKIRAMEIIDELEPTRRSLYTGSVGYFSRGGSSAFNIAIRTFLVEGKRLSYQVGGAIVADSDPEAEYVETLHKGRGMRQALGLAEPLL